MSERIRATRAAMERTISSQGRTIDALEAERTEGMQAMKGWQDRAHRGEMQRDTWEARYDNLVSLLWAARRGAR